MIRYLKKKIMQRLYGGDLKRMIERNKVPDQEVSLKRLKSLGFTPELIYDVGAYKGEFCKTCLEVWPGCRIIAFEALPDKIENLSSLSGGGQVQVVEAIVGDQDAARVHFFADETASSVLESEAIFHEKKHVHQQMIRLDTYIDGGNHAIPSLLKIDTQGYEFQVLKGMEQHLPGVQVILVELNFLEVYYQVKLAHEVIGYLAGFGFVPYDICEIHRRPLDNALFQIDFLFVKKDAALRSDKKWANPQF